RDTPRGLMVTVADTDFRGMMLSPGISSELSRVASVIVSNRLTVEVDGHTSSGGGTLHDEDFSYQRAAAVRDLLVRYGVPSTAIGGGGLGSGRPVVSTASASGREKNRRVEIVIYGDAIGTVPNWDRTYSVVPRR